MSTAHRRQARPQLEPLEDRQLPAAPLLPDLCPTPRVGLIASASQTRCQARSEEAFLLQLTNDLRRRAGIGKFQRNLALVTAAREQALALARNDPIPADVNIHIFGGRDVGQRAGLAGYAWGQVAENVFSTSGRGLVSGVLARRTLSTWLASASHRDNLFDPSFGDVGVGVAVSPSGAWYVVAVFGRGV